MKFIKKNKIEIYLIIFLILSTFIFHTLFKDYSIIQLKSPKTCDIISNISENIDISSMDKSDKLKLRKLYGINPRELEEFQYYAPKTNMQANELLILKVKNRESIYPIINCIEKRVKKQSESFKDYELNEYNLLNKRILKTKGKYVFLIISNNADNIMNEINKSFKT